MAAFGLNKSEDINKVFTIRSVQVMLDKDLASFYEVKPIRLREQIRRNPNRSPLDFVFQLNESVVDLLVSQNAIPSRQCLGGLLPLISSRAVVIEWEIRPLN
jgi:hypothetical protein